MAAAGIIRIIGACTVGAALLLPAGVTRAASKPAPETIPVSIGGGAVDSAAFRYSSALADIISRPPGLPECDPGAACGVPGVVGAARTYDDSATLLKALTEGQLMTAVIPALPLLRARCEVKPGMTPPALSVLKVLYRQPLYLVAGPGAPELAKPKEWAGKAIVTGVPGSSSDEVAGALIDAYRLPRAKIKLLRLPSDQAVAAMRDSTTSVGIFLGHVHDPAVADLISRGLTLMSLPDSPDRARLLRALPVFQVDAIPPDTFPGLPAISTLTQPVLWVTGPAFDQKLAERLVEDVSEPHNQSRLSDMVEPVKPVPEGGSFLRLPIPPAEGAKHFADTKGYPVEILPCPQPQPAAEEKPVRTAKDLKTRR